MLTKTVLCALPDGTCTLLEVEFNWQHGDPIPSGALAQYFPNVADAMSELAGRGRSAARVHVPKPEKPAPPESAARTNDGDTA